VKAASCPKGFSSAALRACVATAVKVYVATWTRELESRGVTGITPPKIVIFSSPPTNPCIDLSETDAVEASFWCGKNGTVYVSANAAKYWTTQYVAAAKERKVLASDAATAGTTTAALAKGFPLVGTTTEVAHELGHWVQEVTGQRPWFDKRLASKDFDVSNRATVIGELAADCMGGWVQGRTAADGTWVDTRIGAWAHHATMAELGGDIYSVKKGFVFPPEKVKDIIGYGSAYSRIRLYDLGAAAGRAGKPGLSTCTTAVAGALGITGPPSP
jgi:predicted metalloprotease